MKTKADDGGARAAPNVAWQCPRRCSLEQRTARPASTASAETAPSQQRQWQNWLRTARQVTKRLIGCVAGPHCCAPTVHSCPESSTAAALLPARRTALLKLTPRPWLIARVSTSGLKKTYTHERKASAQEHHVSGVP